MVPPRDALGVAYESALARQKKVRKSRGAFYTPAFLVDYLIQYTIAPLLKDKAPAEISDYRILDPACGCGAFLLGAFEFLRAWYAERVIPSAEADPTRMAVGHLFGIDSDGEAVKIARRSLAKLSGVPERELSQNVRHGNALTDDCFGRGFDVILANPPYLNGVETSSRLKGARAKHIRSRFVSARGTVDVSILFQELCLRRLRRVGRCGVVVGNKFMSAPFGEAFRELAAKTSRLELLADYSTAGVFGKAAVYPVAYVLSNVTEPGPVRIEVFDRTGKTESRVVKTPLAEVATWDQLFSPGLELLQRLRQDFRPLGEDYEVAASATAAEAYALKEWITDERPAGESFRFVTSGGIDRYVHHHGVRKMRYLKSDFASPYLPVDCPALTVNRRRQYSAQKLIVAGMTRGLEVVWDDGQLAGAVATVQVLGGDRGLPLKGLMAILNSSVMGWWFRQTYGSLALAGGYMRIGSPQVGAIPVWPRVVTERHREMVVELCALAERRMVEGAGVDERIDGLVREWFGVDERDAALLLVRSGTTESCGVPQPMGW